MIEIRMLLFVLIIFACLLALFFSGFVSQYRPTHISRFDIAL